MRASGKVYFCGAGGYGRDMLMFGQGCPTNSNARLAGRRVIARGQPI
jgi:hypothetical protein